VKNYGVKSYMLQSTRSIYIENWNFSDGINIPQVIAEEKDFLVVYKPPRMHSAPQVFSTESLFNWCVQNYPEVGELSGRNKGEGGLLHRLDYETHGLMLLARNALGMEALLGQQKQGKIIKEYSALTRENGIALPGFPKEKPEFQQGNAIQITSAFRPYGKGRKAVRPVLIYDAKKDMTEKLYVTEILESKLTSTFGSMATGLGNCLSLKLRISKGFRHQIRSHLAWLGMPILNDSLYGGAVFGNGCLALRACSLVFADPSTGEECNYSIPALTANDLLKK
jgi:23S rRNA pseudouridine1911/1915/1917 synthase